MAFVFVFFMQGNFPIFFRLFNARTIDRSPYFILKEIQIRVDLNLEIFSGLLKYKFL